MKQFNVSDAYCAGRKQLAEALQTRLSHDPNILKVLDKTLWSPAYSLPNGTPDFFFLAQKWKYRFDAIGFDPHPLRVDKVHNKYLRLQVSTNWYLNLTEYREISDYFQQLSKKTRKKLRWLQNVYSKQHIQFIPISTDSHLEELMRIYLTQWPNSNLGGELRKTLFNVFFALEEMGKNCSYLVREENGRFFAGSLGYLTDKAFNLMILTRQQGVMDKYSPGFFLTFWLIKKFLANDRIDAFFLGPGEFQYKKIFLGQSLPIFRYETYLWQNFWGVVKLYNRLRKEKRKKRMKSARPKR